MENNKVDFNLLKITVFPRVKPGEPPVKFVDLQHYRNWCGGPFYMHCILANYIRFNKWDKPRDRYTTRKAFRQTGKLYNVYSYSDFKYVYTDDPNFTQITSLYKNHQVNENGYWYGFSVLVDPSTGHTRYFMPLLDDDMMVNKINIKLELRYRRWKIRDTIQMWRVIFLLMSIKIVSRVRWCNRTVKHTSCLPVEIAHLIYQYAREPY